MKKTIGFNGKRLLYLFVGLLFSLSVAAMVCTRSFNLNDFFDEGKRTEVDPGGVVGFNVELATYGALQWSCGGYRRMLMWRLRLPVMKRRIVYLPWI